MQNNFSAALLSDKGFQVGPQGVRIAIRLPWYRALPLSVVEIYSLKIDDQPIAMSAITLELYGKSYPSDALGELINEWWYVLDEATLYAQIPALAPSAEHKIELTLNLYPPYIPGLTWATACSKLLRVG
jgi:hypothetical protein